MSCTLEFSSKRTEEVITYAFDLKQILLSGESISSVLWHVYAYRPSTANTGGMILGSPGIFGTKVTQQIQGGDDGALYNLVADVTTSLNNIYGPEALLKVTNDPVR